MPQPADYASIIGAGANIVPDPTTQILQQQMGRLQLAAGEQSLAMQRIALQRQMSFGNDMQSFLQNPTAQGVAQLFGKYPEFHEQIQSGWNTLDTANKRAEVTQLGSIAALTAKGDIDGASELLQQRINADKAAGIDPSTHMSILSALQSGDPQKIKAAQGMMAVAVAGAVPPDKAHDFLTGIGMSQEPIKAAPGDTFINEQGERVAKVPALSTPQVLNTPSGGQQLYGFNPNTGEISGGGGQPEGGGPASGAATGGLQASVAHVLHNEGGYNPKDANGSPTNFGINFKANQPVLAKMGIDASNFKDMTQDQAAQIYASKYWPQSGAEKLAPALQAPYFDVYVRSPKIAKMALAQSGGDPQKFMQVANAAFQSMASNPKSGTAPYKAVWAKRDAGNMALVAGAAPAQGGNQGGAPAGPQPLVSTDNPGASVTKGAPQDYQWNPTHTGVVPIPGSSNDPNSYSPQEIDDLARNWIATGPTAFASLGGGMSGGGIAQLKKAALARASQLMAANGISADQLPAIRSKYGALNSSMAQNTQILNMLEASEKAMHLNAQQVLQKQEQLVKDGIIDNGSPALNNVRLDTYAHIGSPKTKADIKAYQDAVNGLTQEYTKFMNSANGMGGNAAPSDAARGLAMDLNDEGQGPATMKAHINQIFTETGNKRAGIGAQNEKIQAQLSSLLGGHGQGPTRVSNVSEYNALPSGTHYIDPNGVPRIKR